MVDQSTLRGIGQVASKHEEFLLTGKLVNNVVTNILVNNINIHANAFNVNIINAFNEARVVYGSRKPTVASNPFRRQYRAADKVRQ